MFMISFFISFFSRCCMYIFVTHTYIYTYAQWCSDVTVLRYCWQLQFLRCFSFYVIFKCMCMCNSECMLKDTDILLYILVKYNIIIIIIIKKMKKKRTREERENCIRKIYLYCTCASVSVGSSSKNTKYCIIKSHDSWLWWWWWYHTHGQICTYNTVPLLEHTCINIHVLLNHTQFVVDFHSRLQLE